MMMNHNKEITWIGRKVGLLDTNPGEIGVGENTDSALEVKLLLVLEDGLKGKQTSCCLITQTLYTKHV